MITRLAADCHVWAGSSYMTIGRFIIHDGHLCCFETVPETAVEGEIADAASASKYTQLGANFMVFGLLCHHTVCRNLHVRENIREQEVHIKRGRRMY